jgi:hypothetical protein
MVTRRTAIGAGLAFGSVTLAAGFGACGAITPRRREARLIDALLIDQNIETPAHIAALLKAAKANLPVVEIDLDAAGLVKLGRVLGGSHTIAGISSGATLFCLERISWDHGFRLTAHSQTRSRNPSADAFEQDVAAFVSGIHSATSSPSPPGHDYRPSRADGLLHAWIMQKSSPQFRPAPREV